MHNLLLGKVHAHLSPPMTICKLQVYLNLLLCSQLLMQITVQVHEMIRLYNVVAELIFKFYTHLVYNSGDKSNKCVI